MKGKMKFISIYRHPYHQVRQKKKEEELALKEKAKKTTTKNDDDSDSDSEDEVGGEKLKGFESEGVASKDARQRTTTRNLRIREDTAKYLLNLDVNSAYYDPKSRSMRENPLADRAEGDQRTLDFSGIWFFFLHSLVFATTRTDIDVVLLLC